MKLRITLILVVSYLLSWIVNSGVLLEIEEHHGDAFISLYSEQFALILSYVHAFPMGIVSVMFGYEFNFPWVVFAPLNLVLMLFVYHLADSKLRCRAFCI